MPQEGSPPRGRRPKIASGRPQPADPQGSGAGVALRTRAWIETTPITWSSKRSTSPSVRGRGLKHDRRRRRRIELKSPSVRGRGLKLVDIEGSSTRRAVALRTRAWIETTMLTDSDDLSWSPSVRGRGLKLHVDAGHHASSDVALRTRAWIETKDLLSPTPFLGSSPSVRGRGLKHHRRRRRRIELHVALRTRAWIETVIDVNDTSTD